MLLQTKIADQKCQSEKKTCQKSHQIQKLYQTHNSKNFVGHGYRSRRIHGLVTSMHTNVKGVHIHAAIQKVRSTLSVFLCIAAAYRM